MENDKRIVIICMVSIFVIFLWWRGSSVSEQREAQLKPLAQSIIASHRPRIISFYADWCGSCKAFDPILMNVVGSFGNSVELQMINIDNPQNRELMKIFDVTGIPATFMFDRHGHQMGENCAFASAHKLDQMIRQMVEQK